MAGFEDLSDEQRASLARAMHDLLGNREVSMDVKRALMKIRPDASFPEVRQADAVSEQLAERDKRISELDAKLMEQEQVARRERLHAQARERGLKPEDVERVVTDYKVMDWDKAMEICERLSQSAAPSPPETFDHTVSMPSEKDLWANPDKWAREQAHAQIDQLRGRRTN